MGEIKGILEIADIIFPNSDLEAKVLSEVFQIDYSKFHVTYNGIAPHFCVDSQPSAEVFREQFQMKDLMRLVFVILVSVDFPNRCAL